MDLVEILHLKSDVMEAEPVLATFGARHRIVLEAENREIEVAVAEIVASRAVGIDLASDWGLETSYEAEERLQALLRRDAPDLARSLRSDTEIPPSGCWPS